MAIDKAKRGNKVIRAFKKVFTRKEKCEIKMKTPAGHEISFKGTESLAKHMLCDKNGYFQRTPNSSVNRRSVRRISSSRGTMRGHRPSVRPVASVQRNNPIRNLRSRTWVHEERNLDALEGATMGDFSNFHDSHENVTEEIYDERFVF